MILIMSFLVALCVIIGAYAVYGFYKKYHSEFTKNASLTLDDMFMFIDPEKLFFVNIIVLFVVPVLTLLLTGSIPFAIILTLLAVLMPRIMYSVIKKRRIKNLIEQMPDALNMMAGSLRSGSSLSMAMDFVATETAPPFSQELSLVLREQKMGVSFEDAMESMARRLTLEEVDLMVSAITISKSVGGNLAEVLERLANTLRSKAAMEGKIKALTSQGKLQGIVVGLLPVFLGIVLFQMEPEAMQPLFTTLYGWITVCVITVMLLVGAFFIKKIVTIDV
jgi:tight adherence protein B